MSDNQRENQLSLVIVTNNLSLTIVTKSFFQIQMSDFLSLLSDCERVTFIYYQINEYLNLSVLFIYNQSIKVY